VRAPARGPAEQRSRSRATSRTEEGQDRARPPRVVQGVLPGPASLTTGHPRLFSGRGQGNARKKRDPRTEARRAGDRRRRDLFPVRKRWKSAALGGSASEIGGSPRG